MFRAPLCPSSRAQDANRTHNPQLHTRPATWKTTAQNTTGSNHCIILLSSWWWAWWCPKHVEQTIRSAIKPSVASSWHFISTYYSGIKLKALHVSGSYCTHHQDLATVHSALAHVVQVWRRLACRIRMEQDEGRILRKYGLHGHVYCCEHGPLPCTFSSTNTLSEFTVMLTVTRCGQKQT